MLNIKVYKRKQTYFGVGQLQYSVLASGQCLDSKQTNKQTT